MSHGSDRERVAVITGASRGIGAAMAQVYAERGLRLGVCSRGEPVLAESDAVVSRRVDVTDPNVVDDFATAVAGRFGRIDLWINNAGVIDPIAFVRDMTAAQFERLMQINVAGVFNGTRAFLRHRGPGEGVLINISSGAGRKPSAGWAAYCASKAAVDRFSECLALEEPELRVHSVAPGVIDTRMQEQIRATPRDQFPSLDRFLEMKEKSLFSTPTFVAERLYELAFDPTHRPDEVIVRLADENR